MKSVFRFITEQPLNGYETIDSLAVLDSLGTLKTIFNGLFFPE